MKTDIHSITSFLTQKISMYAKIPVSELHPDRALEDIGLSSLDVVMISGKIEDEFEIEIEPNIIFESKTINEVVQKVINSKV